MIYIVEKVGNRNIFQCLDVYSTYYDLDVDFRTLQNRTSNCEVEREQFLQDVIFYQNLQNNRYQTQILYDKVSII